MKYALPTESMRQDIVRRSHARSAAYGVSRSITCAPESSRLSPAALDKRKEKRRLMLDLVLAQMDALYQVLVDSSYGMAVADEEGYVLEVLGHPSMLAQYQTRKCLPGYRWSEKDIGTCSIGLVLHEHRPIMLLRDEMFSTSAAHITNSAAPIFDHKDNFLGVITLGGPADAMHLHTLGLVAQASATVRARFAEIAHANEIALRNQYLVALLESDRRGIVTLDPQGEIVHHNRKAQTLLALPEEAKGANIDKTLRGPLKLTPLIRQGKGFWDREFSYEVEGQLKTHIATLDPIHLPDGAYAGCLLMVVEKQHMFNLVNTIVGTQASFTFDSILGDSPALHKAMDLCRAAAKSSSPVLLSGETGSGKELFAQAIHNASARAHKPFVVINCGAIPKELLESELFGYEEGAFTGASKKGRPGKLELANGGTFFLDEIGDMPFDMQVKLLRVFQSGELQRLGGRQTLTLDLRIIAATNVDLKLAMQRKEFREDLYYRISTFHVSIPPLRARDQDVCRLAEFFLQRCAASFGKGPLRFSPEAKQALCAYSWPGNVRQLENWIERVVNLASSAVISAEELELPEDSPPPAAAPLTARHSGTLEDVEFAYIRQRMQEEKGNIRRVASLLGISRQTLYRKLEMMRARGDWAEA